MRIALMITVGLLAGACGPSAEEVAADNAAKEAESRCNQLFNATKKVTEEFLWSQGVAEVTLVDKTKFTDKCIAMNLTQADIRCMDPNTGGGEECKDKRDELQKFMISPMTEKKDEAKDTDAAKEGEGAEGAAKDGEATE